MKDVFKRFAVGCIALLMALTLGSNFFLANAQGGNESSSSNSNSNSNPNNYYSTQYYEYPNFIEQQIPIDNSKVIHEFKNMSYITKKPTEQESSTVVNDWGYPVKQLDPPITLPIRPFFNEKNDFTVTLPIEIDFGNDAKYSIYYQEKGNTVSTGFPFDSSNIQINGKTIKFSLNRENFVNGRSSSFVFLVIENTEGYTVIQLTKIDKSWDLLELMLNDQTIARNKKDNVFYISKLKDGVNKLKINLYIEFPLKDFKFMYSFDDEFKQSKLFTYESEQRSASITVPLTKDNFTNNECTLKLKVLTKKKNGGSNPVEPNLQFIMPRGNEDESLKDYEDVGTYGIIEITLKLKEENPTPNPDPETPSTPTAEPTNKPDVPSYPTTSMTDRLVKFHVEEGYPSLQTQHVPFGGKARQSEVQVPVRSGYEFDGWYYYEKDSYKLGPNGTEKMLPFSFDQAIYGDIDLYAKWKKIEEDTGVEEEEKKPVPSTADC